MDQHQCLNCQTAFSGSFCNNCGQKITHRYTVSHVLHELVHVFTHADKGIFSFAGQLITKPGIIALDLVEGKRKRYFNLFQFLILIAGLSTFLGVKVNVYEQTMQNINAVNGTEISIRIAAFQKASAQFMQQYNNILQLVLIPVFALFSWLFLGRKRYNYAENIVLHTASSAQMNIFSVVTLTSMLVIKNKTYFGILTAGSLVIVLVSFAMSYKQFYKLSAAKSILFALLIYACSFVVQMILTAIAMISYLIATHK